MWKSNVLLYTRDLRLDCDLETMVFLHINEDSIIIKRYSQGELILSCCLLIGTELLLVFGSRKSIIFKTK